MLTHLQHSIFPVSILQGTGAERVATVTCDHLLSLIETQGQRLASNSYVVKDGIKPGACLPCKAFLNWPKPEDLNKAASEGTSSVATLGEGKPGVSHPSLGSRFSDKDDGRKGCLFKGPQSRDPTSEESQKLLKEGRATRVAEMGTEQ